MGPVVELVMGFYFYYMISVCVTLSSIFCFFRYFCRRHRRKDGKKVVGFFHPNSNDGGGGERVMWCAVRALQNAHEDCHIVIYTACDLPPEIMLDNVAEQFGVVPKSRIEFVRLRTSTFLNPSNYPVLTLFFQSVGSVFVGLESLYLLNPDVFIDTTGFAFTYPIFRFVALSKVITYTHYPTISTDMLNVVAERRPNATNRKAVAKSALLSRVKLAYYYIFAGMYGIAGKCADGVMVNSSWTAAHINAIWKISGRTRIVFPPVDVESLKKFDIRGKRENKIVSIAQFRPEKDHLRQLRSFARMREIFVENGKECKTRLILIGSCRNADDRKILDFLKHQAVELGIADYVDFLENCTYDVLKKKLRTCLIGLHTMWNEHFGIVVVEYQASGLLAVAHNTGGPRADIVRGAEVLFNEDPEIVSRCRHDTGFLCKTVEEYAQVFSLLVEQNEKKSESLMRMRELARASTDRFSESVFETDFLEHFEEFAFDKHRMQ